MRASSSFGNRLVFSILSRAAGPLLCASLVVPAGCAAHHAIDGAAKSAAAAKTAPARAHAADHDETTARAHVLLYQVHVALDDAGRQTRTMHRRYRIEDASAADQGWATTSSEWSPWRDEKPELSAFVLSPDGTRHALDPATIEDARTAQGDDAVYSDRRIVRAPLPAIEVGSIVDETVVTRTKQPLAPRAAGGAEALGDPGSCDQLEIVVDAPESLPFVWKLFADGEKVVDERVGGRRRISLTAKNHHRDDNSAPWLPDEVVAIPYLQYATGKSWNALATYYGGLVDGRLQGAAVGAKANGAIDPKDDVATKVRKLTELVQREVRYTGLELGESAIMPHTPAETLQRRYGDCKDQASLLIALLRSVGVDAYVALLNVSGVNADPDLPGLGVFDHAIVYVPGPKPMWVDPIDTDAHPGTLAPTDEGRFALIASPKTTTLVRTPESSAADNVYRERREVWLPEEGRARLVETDSATGLYERALRAQFRSPEAVKRETAEGYVKSTYAAEKLGTYAFSVDDMSKPFTLKYEAIATPRGVSNDETAEMSIDATGILNLVPSSVLKEGREVGAQLRYAHRVEIEIVVHADDAFEAASAPENDSRKLGPATFSSTFVRDDAKTMHARIVFELPKRRLSVDDLRAFREQLAEYNKLPRPRLRFPNRAARLAAQGHSDQALELLKARASAPGATYAAGRRYVSELLRLGFIGEAQRVSARFAADSPTQDPPAVLSASCALHDSLGRTFGGDVRFANGIDMIEKVLARSPKNALAAEILGESLYVDAAGRPTSDHARLLRAKAAFEAWEKTEADTSKDGIYPMLLMRLGDMAGARKVMTKRAPSDQRRNTLLALAAIEGGSDGVTRALEDLAVAQKDRIAALDAAAAIATAARQYPAVVLLREAQMANGEANDLKLQAARSLRDARPKETPDVAAARAFWDDVLFLGGEGRSYEGSATVTKEQELAVDGVHVGWVADLVTYMPADVIRDSLHAIFDVQRVRQIGDLSHVRIEPIGGGAALEVLVTNDGPRSRVVAMTEWPEPAIGANAADALSHGHEAQARAILDWYFGQHEPETRVPTWHPGIVVWRQTHDLTQTLAAMRPYEDDAAAFGSLERARKQATDRDLRNALDSALAIGQAYAGSEAFAATLERMRTDDGVPSTSLRPLEVSWRARRGELAQVDKLLADPNIPASAKSADYARAGLERARLGKFAEAYETYLKADGLTALSPHDANNAAWYGLLAGRGGEARVLTFARRGASADGSDALHTLASVEAGYADLSSAIATIAKWKAALGRSPMRPVQGLPIALLAERHGLVDEAIRLLEPIARETNPRSAGAFARQRLDALRKRAPSASSAAVSIKAEMP